MKSRMMNQPKFFEEFRKQESSRANRAFLFMSAIFIGALVMTNAIAGKFFILFGHPLSSGIIAYPITFLITDLISEIYGLKKANLLVKAGFLVSLFVTLIVIIANRALIYDQSPVSQESFHMVFGLMPGIVFGSMAAYLSAQFFDVRVFEYWRKLTNGKYLWLRNNGSTMLSQIIDTVVVVTVALVIWPQVDANPQTIAIDWGLWRDIVIGQYIFKAALALLDTPFFYAGVFFLKHWIAADPMIEKETFPPA